MIKDKKISLEEARKYKQLDRFIQEHPSEGDKTILDSLFEKMIPKSNT